MENASKRVISFLLAMLMILEVLEPTIVSAQSLLNEDTGQVQREDKIFDDSPGDRGSSKNEFVIESKNPKENEQIEKSKAEPKREDTSKGTQRKENPKEEKQIHKEEKQNFKEENRKQNLKVHLLIELIFEELILLQKDHLILLLHEYFYRL